ncbi:hypothetical protein CONPUDRAFT_74364 [Coniophora puteana RWD-64-598 SS2]|uniref:Uncharacterized protein n=1 Tax=Coniophora puteana (strain RWD-64-598) TaxID=741705 RepID=A0A5M3MLL6_CONPW|nr:uncharacterized protein CONPUDRAFT_74364 [Coniophora puteana RWD-64-598 SS2]EIW80119.1 hypothetical protein CONPUDRAFT_74364 [Coniophora puteana RWD-64-598 SS2]
MKKAYLCHEPYSGYVLWLKLWWTNCNPRLICSWYCDTVRELGRTKNNGVANSHTLLRHAHDPYFANTLQHKFKFVHGNIKPEIFWSQLRQCWTPGFEDILDIGLITGIYDPSNSLKRLIFQYIFIPWIQQELDLF